MAKKDSFSFDSEESSFNLKQKLTQWEENLTQKQKTLIISIAISLLVVVIVVSILIAIAVTGGSNQSNNGSNGGTTGGSDVGSGEGNNNQDDENGSNDGSDNQEELLTGVYISTKPIRLTYYVGDNADYSGLQLELQGFEITKFFVDYNTSPEDFTITGFDSSAPAEEQVITVEYKGFTATFNVTILEVPLTPATLESIYLNPAPKATVTKGKSLSVKDAQIVCVYSDGTTKTVKLTHNHLYGYASALSSAEVGDVVTVGQPIACPPEGALGTSIHASINGTVTAVTENFVTIKA